MTDDRVFRRVVNIPTTDPRPVWTPNFGAAAGVAFLSVSTTAELLRGQGREQDAAALEADALPGDVVRCAGNELALVGEEDVP